MALKSQKANDTRHFFDPFFALFGGYPPYPPLPPRGGWGGWGIPGRVGPSLGFRGVWTPPCGAGPGGLGPRGRGQKSRGPKSASKPGLNTTLRGTPPGLHDYRDPLRAYPFLRIKSNLSFFRPSSLLEFVLFSFFYWQENHKRRTAVGSGFHGVG